MAVIDEVEERTETPSRGGLPPAPVVRHGLVAAGQILGIGLLCFAVWLLLDARQLYNSAVASSHFGARRTVAIAILRPIARVNEALGLDRLVDGGNRLVGRNDYTAGGEVGTATTVHHHHKPPTTTPKTSTSAPPPTVPPGPPALVQPTPAHPLSITVIGDSIGEDLGMGLGDVVGDDKSVVLHEDAVGSSGLADVDYYNWPASFEHELKTERPGLVIAMFGGNDWQSFPTANGNAYPGTGYWRREYGARVAQMMAEATNAGAHVVWVGLPIMGPGSGLPAKMAPTLNSIYASEARSHPGVSFYSTWKLFSNAKGQYAEYLPNSSGDLVEVRDSDGVHIAPTAGTDRIGSAVLSYVESTFGLKL